ncbi:uncharacterized protein [Rutidosis leptorrhynchoides]|uniref:uncharacterized protein n=1 Tax=Rutidosis leptorrhynchoides TaxID=125765 RepID=UPI003A99EE26
MKKDLEKLVNINQSAFIPGRAIQDNILVTRELLKGYNRLNGPKRCALKIDLQKTYDTVSWSFLKSILAKFGFHDKMVGWIMNCVSTTKFSVCINNEIKGYFHGGRGLRQGDPISPYLFTLVMEVLNLILANSIKVNPLFKFHVGCKKMKLTHVCFADDLLVFCHGDVNSIKVIKQALEEFSQVSGLLPDMHKSTVFFGSVNMGLQNEITQLLPFKVGKLPVKYLGVPLLDKRLGVADCREIIDKIKCELSKGKAKVAWKIVCTPKNQGGLGLKHLREWNDVLLTKQLWKLIEQKDSLWFNWVNIVKLKGRTIWEIEGKQNDSWGWKQLLELRDRVKDHVDVDDQGLVKWITNNGSKANPKHAFIVWLAFLDRLTTQEKLMNWYPNQCLKCELCGKCEDSSKHLFFDCDYSNKVWNELKKRLLFRGLPDNLQGIVNMLANFPFRSQIWDIINRLTVAAGVYHVWQERNSRVFNRRRRKIEDLVMHIEDVIRMKLTTFSVKSTNAMIRAAKNWDLEVIGGRLVVKAGSPNCDDEDERSFRFKI